MQPLTVTLIGAGLRGARYSEYARKNPHEMRIAAVADPDDYRRNNFQEKYDLLDEQCFEHWDELFQQPKLSDAVFICTRIVTILNQR